MMGSPKSLSQESRARICDGSVFEKPLEGNHQGSRIRAAQIM